jgi:ketosteroid isomerase-like protein
VASEHQQSLSSAARIFLQHFGRRDSDVALGLMSDRVTYRVPGHSALSGTFSGREAVADHLAKVLDLAGGTMAAVKVEDVMEGLSHVAAIVDAHGQGGGRSYRGRNLYLFSFDADGLIDDIALFPCDEAALERFIGP